MWWGRQPRRRVLAGIAAGTALATTGAVGSESAVEPRILETTAPVAAGARIEVTGSIESAAATTVDVSLVVGRDPETVEERPVELETDERTSITLGYETPRVARTQTFPVRLETGDGSDERLVTVLGTDDGASAPLRPASDRVEVRPDTAVLFEVATGRRLEPGDLEWSVDDELAGDLALAADYTYFTGTGASLAAPEDVGTHEIGVTVPTESGSATHEWTLAVDPGGQRRPTIESLESDPGADATVGIDDAVETTLVARDDAGELARVVWIEGQNHTVVGIDELEDDRAEATFTRTGPGWVAAGYPTMARVVCEDGRTSELVTVDGPEIRPPFEVEIVATNEPLEGGDRLAVRVAVTNEGGMMNVGDTTQEIELLVGTDRERVDTTTVTVPFGTSETVVLGYETYPVAETDVFPIRVESPDDAAERTVAVRGIGG
ncbi:hypothetical protein [Natronococcus occultus]|uniref:CARDB domain-containing protein n=1 Tax=Natronococcus occultus SP4 TaxID=694430 RepID=L0JZ15_9EURY|nr:hypothetical protein [Natronococcus occultus]AGB38001.1 hypothetical protein Natoc_2222 [Natronococcus occultus SP4]